MKRTPLRRTKSIRRFIPKAERSKYALRERDTPRMLFVKTMLCSVVEEWPDPHRQPTRCWGPIEADHAGPRGLSQKCADEEVIPLCKGHHGERTDHNGSFKYTKKLEVREWRQRAILRTQTMWAERDGSNVA